MTQINGYPKTTTREQWKGTVAESADKSGLPTEPQSEPLKEYNKTNPQPDRIYYLKNGHIHTRIKPDTVWLYDWLPFLDQF